MAKSKKTIDQTGARSQESIDILRAELREHSNEVRASLAMQQEAIEELQVANAQQQEAITMLQAAASTTTRALTHLHSAATATEHALLRHEHTLDQSMARVADDLNRHRENVGTAIYGYVEDVNALKTEVRGLAARVDALERDTPPAA